MEVVGTAVGLTPCDEAKDRKILRRVNGKETVRPFRYADVVAVKALEQNIILDGCDVIVVP